MANCCDNASVPNSFIFSVRARKEILLTRQHLCGWANVGQNRRWDLY